jgi:hypothetical protein
MTEPTSRQRGRPTETRQQLSDNNLRTESTSNIRSLVSEWARYLDVLTDRPTDRQLLRDFDLDFVPVRNPVTGREARRIS